MSRKPSTENERDHALIAEIVGYLRGLAYQRDENGTSAERAPALLSHRLECFERKTWPLE